jgi:hypothetical protein
VKRLDKGAAADKPAARGQDPDLAQRAGPAWLSEDDESDECLVWYGDGDLMAVCYSNLGLGVSSQEIAQALVEAINRSGNRKLTPP